LDHATGWLLAAAAVDAVAERLRTGRTRHARLSLARTALALGPADPRPTDDLAPEDEADLAPGLERTGWGPARRLRPRSPSPASSSTPTCPPAPRGRTPRRGERGEAHARAISSQGPEPCNRIDAAPIAQTRARRPG